jgi:hypothetical protein
MHLFTAEQQETLRRTKEIEIDEYGEFVKLSQKEKEKLLNIKYDGTWHYYLTVNYIECDTKTYEGISIHKNNGNEDEEIIRINSGDIEEDEDLALAVFCEMVGEDTNIRYLSSYDNYFDDLQYENDPVFRAEVDAIRKELEEEYPEKN